jgi:hypothetical protein
MMCIIRHLYLGSRKHFKISLIKNIKFESIKFYMGKYHWNVLCLEGGG